MGQRQTSFIGGEISPNLWGRTDIERYATAVRTARNFLITPQGAALNRTGSKYVFPTFSTDVTKPVILVPFYQSDGDSIVIEFGDTYMCFYKNDEPIWNGFTPLMYGTPYIAEELAGLQFTQVGDVMTITAKDAPPTIGEVPATLTRIADNNWVLADVTFSLYSSYFGGGKPAIWQPTPIEDIANSIVKREWIWKLTAVVQDNTTRAIYETTPFQVTEEVNLGLTARGAIAAGNKYAVHPNAPIKLRWAYPDALGAPYQPANYTTYTVLSYRVYRGRGSVFGLVGQTYGQEFTDVGDAPDYLTQPPVGTNPFEVLNQSSGALIRRENPISSCYFEQRQVYAGTYERPGIIWLSRTGDYLNYDKPFPAGDSASIELELASLRKEEIRSCVGLDRLFLLTSGGIWTVQGVGGPLTATNVQALQQSTEGAGRLPAIVTEDSLLYIPRSGAGVRAFAFENERGKFGVDDLAVYASHLFKTGRIISWAYARNPYSIVWAVTSDGRLLSLTYNRTQQVIAWAWHDTEGTYESVCAIPNYDDDIVWVAVTRVTDGIPTRYVECFSAPREPNVDYDLEDIPFLDAWIKKSSGTPFTSVMGLGHLEGQSVMAVADGVVMGPFVVRFGVITLPVEASIVFVGLPYVSDLETLDLSHPKLDISAKQKLVASVSFDVVASRGLWTGETFDGLTEWRQRTVADSYGAVPTFTGKVKVRISSNWNTGGRACVRQVDPLPLAIHGLSREVILGGE